MSLWKTPVGFTSLFAGAMGMFFLIGGMRTGEDVIPVCLALSTILVLGGTLNGEIVGLKKRIVELERTQRE